MVTAASGVDPSALITAVSYVLAALIAAWAAVRGRRTTRRLNGSSKELSIEELRVKVAELEKRLAEKDREIEKKDAALEYQQEQLLEYGRALATCHEDKKSLEKQLAAAQGGK